MWEETKKLGINKKLYLLPVILFLLGGALGGAGVYFYLKSDLPTDKSEPLSSEETQKLVARVSELILLPQDEQPTIATVADPEKLKDQPFFAKAQKGFKVLIYTKAKKAILYDPVSHKIVEVAPLNIGDTAGIKAEATP